MLLRPVRQARSSGSGRPGATTGSGRLRSAAPSSQETQHVGRCPRAGHHPPSASATAVRHSGRCPARAKPGPAPRVERRRYPTRPTNPGPPAHPGRPCRREAPRGFPGGATDPTPGRAAGDGRPAAGRSGSGATSSPGGADSLAGKVATMAGWVADGSAETAEGMSSDGWPGLVGAHSQRPSLGPALLIG